MATWQYRAWIILANRITDGPADARSILQDDETAHWANLRSGWADAIPVALRLAPFKSWSASIRAWGAQDGTCVEEFTDDRGNASVQCSIDVRELGAPMIDALAASVRSLGAVLLDAQGHVTSPDPLEILSVVQRSSAFRFVEDPQAFLDELERRRTRH